MNMLKKPFFFLLALAAMLPLTCPAVTADVGQKSFALVKTQALTDVEGTAYYYKHRKTGAEVVYLDNGAQRLEFSIGFKTPPTDSKGANHVLEHGLLCGSETYPTKNVMHYLEQGSASLVAMGVTVDDCTYYPIRTMNPTEYYNVLDVYLNGIFYPLLLKDENIFRQQGIRLEYAGGAVRYNGVVYNELRMKQLDTAQNSLTFLGEQLYAALYGDTPPAFHSGGSIEALKTLTYEDVLRVYHTYYVPSNSMTYLSGKQDIGRTLDLLDHFFMAYDKHDVDISFQDTKRLPAEPVSTYHITEGTSTVDIGILFSGVPAYEDEKERYARDIIFNLIRSQMNQIHENTYVLGGNSGGISTLALLISEVPIEQKDSILTAHQAILDQFAASGFDDAALDTEIERYFADKKNPYTNALDLKIFSGLTYRNDPFIHTDLTGVETYLRNHKDYFSTVLRKYFTENSYHKTVVSGNPAGAAPDETVSVSAGELEQIKQETAAFQAWADAPDDPAVINRLPLLTLDEVKDAPAVIPPVLEQAAGISFYYTEKHMEPSATLFFPLAVKYEDLNDLQLLYAFLTDQAQDAGLTGFRFGLLPMEDAHNRSSIHPQFVIALTGEDKPAALAAVTAFLQDESLWTADRLQATIKTAPADLLANRYQDPYYLSYELMQSALSAGKAFCFSSTGSIQQGSPVYYQFLKGLDPAHTGALLEKLKALVHTVVLDNRPTAEYVGDRGYEGFKKAVIEQFQTATARQSSALPLPAGCDSAATITKREDANHFMIAGCYDNQDGSGKLSVLGKVLSANYLQPTLRGKYGAYGSGISFDTTRMVSSVTGMGDIDQTLEVWQGMGNYLRSLTLTQHELDAIIVSAVKEFDDYDYASSEYGAQSALTGRTQADLAAFRSEMLSTTVEDLRGYADFVDALVAQNRVFAVLGRDAAENAAFPFSYFADADTLEITPRWKKDIQRYINGKADTLFAPDDEMTRGEIAALITRLAADGRAPAFESRFQDVTPEAWYYEAVVSATEKNFMSGSGSGLFLPEQPITRAELAAVLSRFLFQGSETLTASYSDLSPNDWYYAPMAKLVNKGYLKGYGDGTLRPGAPVTRAEVVALLNRILDIPYKEQAATLFTDVTESHWAYRDIMAAA